MKLHLKLLYMLSTAMFVSSCVNTELQNANKPYNPVTDARIRLYGQNGRPTTLIIDPYGKKETVSVGGGVSQAFASLMHSKENESIGMPESEFSRAPQIFDNIGSNSFYKEFVIPTDVPIALKNTIQTPAHVFKKHIGNKIIIETRYLKCGKNGLEDAVIFQAEPDTDYEAIPPLTTMACGITLLKLN